MKRDDESSTALSIRRRTFLAMVAAGSVAVTSTSRRPSREGGIGTSWNVRDATDNEPTMPIENVYRIARNYRVGPKRKRPPAGKAEGSIWEVTDANGRNASRRTLSDGERWITLNVESGSSNSGQTRWEHYLTPDEGFDAIQDVIDRTGGNVVIRLAPGTYVGSELTLTDGVVLEGAGRRATILKLENGANTDLVRTPEVATRNVQECTLRDITFEGNRANNDSGSVVYGAFWNGRFIDCEFNTAPEHGFWLAGSDGSTDDNYFRGCRFVRNAEAGLRGGANRETYRAVGVVRIDTNWFGNNDGPAIIARGNSWKIGHSKFYGNGPDDGPTIELDRCSYSSVAGCDLYSGNESSSLVDVLAYKGADSVGNRVTDNDLRGNYGTAVNCRAEGNDMIALQVCDNVIQSEGNAGSGVAANTEDGGTFVDCSVADNTFAGSFDDSKFVLPDGWSTAGNVGAGDS